MGTILVLAILFIIVGFIIRSMIRDKKAGKSIQCGHDCSKCAGHCMKMDTNASNISSSRKA